MPGGVMPNGRERVAIWLFVAAAVIYSIFEAMI
jgi:hypothetical protein